MTYRITGHSRRDPAQYQSDDEKKKALEKEPIRRYRNHLISKHIATDASLEEIDKGIDIEIEKAVQSAMYDPEPENLYEDLFVE